jgi:hypothetical protein
VKRKLLKMRLMRPKEASASMLTLFSDAGVVLFAPPDTRAFNRSEVGLGMMKVFVPFTLNSLPPLDRMTSNNSDAGTPGKETDTSGKLVLKRGSDALYNNG